MNWGNYTLVSALVTIKLSFNSQTEYLPVLGLWRDVLAELLRTSHFIYWTDEQQIQPPPPLHFHCVYSFVLMPSVGYLVSDLPACSRVILTNSPGALSGNVLAVFIFSSQGALWDCEFHRRGCSFNLTHMNVQANTEQLSLHWLSTLCTPYWCENILLTLSETH